MSRKKSKSSPTPTVLAPLRGCKFCGGTGWVKSLVGPLNKAGPDGRLVIYEPPMERCSCTMPQRRDQVAAPEPAPAALDQAQRAAGEKED